MRSGCLLKDYARHLRALRPLHLRRTRQWFKISSLRLRGLRTAILSCPTVISSANFTSRALVPRFLTVLLRFWMGCTRQGPFQGASISQVRGKPDFILAMIAMQQVKPNKFKFRKGLVPVRQRGQGLPPNQHENCPNHHNNQGVGQIRAPPRMDFCGGVEFRTGQGETHFLNDRRILAVATAKPRCNSLCCGTPPRPIENRKPLWQRRFRCPAKPSCESRSPRG